MNTNDLPSKIIISKHNNNRPKTFGIVIGDTGQSLDKAIKNGWLDHFGTSRQHTKTKSFIELQHKCGLPWYVYPLSN